MWQVDTVGDGVADTLIPLQAMAGGADVASAARRAELIDTTGDGLPDTVAVDTVGDGVADKFVRLRGDASAPQQAHPRTAATDWLRRVELIDTTRDGRPDTLAVRPRRTLALVFCHRT